MVRQRLGIDPRDCLATAVVCAIHIYKDCCFVYVKISLVVQTFFDGCFKNIKTGCKLLICHYKRC